MGHRFLVILDLNGTLCTTDYQNQTYGNLKLEPDFNVYRKFVYLRPFIDTFLDHLFANFDVAVWTCNSQRYATGLAKEVFRHYFPQLKFVWDQTDSTPLIEGSDEWVKDLRKVWERFPQYDSKTTVLVDDSPTKAGLYPNNLIQITTYQPSNTLIETNMLKTYKKLQDWYVNGNI